MMFRASRSKPNPGAHVWIEKKKLQTSVNEYSKFETGNECHLY